MRRKNNSIIGWGVILIALASAVGIYFLPEYAIWFLAILLLNLLVSLLFGNKFSNGALTVCRLLVGALFVFSSFTKGIDPLGTKYKILDYLAAYHIEWLNGLAMALSVGMILAEFLVGICLVANVFPRLSVLGATLLMLFFTTTTLFDAMYDLVPDCGCFGTVVKMSNWQTFYKNLVIDAVLIPLVLNNKRLENKFAWGSQFVAGCIFSIAFLGFELYNYRHLPMFDFMNWKVGKQMNAQPDEPARIYLKYRNKTTGQIQEYLSPDYPWDDSVWMSQWEFVEQRTEGGANYLGFSALDEDGTDVTDLILNTENLLMFTSHDLGKVTEKEWIKIENITEQASRKGYTVIWVVANNPETLDEMRQKHACLHEVYFGDALEIKTIVRFNPGLVWLDNGLVKDKWSAVDFQKVLKVL